MKNMINNVVLILKALYGRAYHYYDSLTSKRVECSIGDIMLRRDVPYNNQLLITSRLMDVEAFMNQGDETFICQNTISKARYGETHNEIEGNKSFKALIESYKKEGYRNESYVICDKEMRLSDGTHRMGLQIYAGLERINAKVLKRIIPFSYSGDGYYNTNLPTVFLEHIYERYEEIQKWLIESGMTFSAYLKSGKKDFDLKNDMYRLCTILNVKETALGGAFLSFSMPNPDYIIKNGKLYSKRAEEIENILRNRAGSESKIIVSKNCIEGRQMYVKFILNK